MSFTLSCFADEISDSLDVQLREMKLRGIRYLELRSVFGKNVSELTAAQTRELKSRLDAEGVGVSALGSPIGKIKISDDFEPHFEKFQRLTETAKTLGTRYIRIFSFYPPDGAKDPEEWYGPVCERLERLIGEARRDGVVLLHENEKEIYGDVAPRCAKLMQRFFCENFAVTFDPANFVQCGQPVMEAYRLLKPYIRYIHIKDAMFSDGRVVPAGCGDGEVAELLTALKADGYDGFLSLEPHLGDFAGFAGLERGEKREFDTKTDSVGRFDLAVSELKKVLEALK